MSGANEWRTPPPDTCPYCGASVGHLPRHLPCDDVPPTPGYEDDL